MEGKGKKTMQEAGCWMEVEGFSRADSRQRPGGIRETSAKGEVPVNKVSDAGRQRPKAVSCRECPVEDTRERFLQSGPEVWIMTIIPLSLYPFIPLSLYPFPRTSYSPAVMLSFKVNQI